MKRIEEILKRENPREELKKELGKMCNEKCQGGSCSECTAAFLMHEVKTLKEVFLERNPNAPLSPDGTPRTCPEKVGLAHGNCRFSCPTCWDRPYTGDIQNAKEDDSNDRD